MAEKREGPFLIRCEGMPGWWHAAHPMPDALGQYLQSYDPSDPSGQAWTWTKDPEQARKFGDAMQAFKCWTAVNELMPERPTDGKPNKPLTCFTIMVVTLSEALERSTT